MPPGGLQLVCVSLEVRLEQLDKLERYLSLECLLLSEGLSVELPVKGVGTPLDRDNVFLKILREAHLGVYYLVVHACVYFTPLVIVVVLRFAEVRETWMVFYLEPVLWDTKSKG